MEQAWPLGHYFEDPVLYAGVDVATERDTAAVVVIARHPEKLVFGLWGHQIFQPPVNIHTTVVALLEKLLDRYRVGKICYDPFQFKSEAQRLEEKGFERIMVQVNQQSEMIEHCNTLDTHFKQRSLLLYADSQLRSHFSWAAVQVTERGFRIVKRRQSRPIDGVVAAAMALTGAAADPGWRTYPAYREDIHARSVFVLP